MKCELWYDSDIILYKYTFAIHTELSVTDVTSGLHTPTLQV